MFGRRLRELRVARGLSQAELVGTDLSAAYLSRLESGARPPTERVLSLLCARLGVTPAEFQAPVGSPLAQALATVATVGETLQTAMVLEDALLRDGEGDVVLRWQVLWLLARCYQVQGRSDDELRVLRDLVALSDEVDLPDIQARSQVRLARKLRGSGELTEARAVAGNALELATERELPFRDVVEATLTIISIDAETGQLADARKRADRLTESLGKGSEAPLSERISPRLEVELLWTAAGVALRQGDQKGTADLLQAALDRMPSNEDPVLWMRLRLAAASMFLQMDPRDTRQARLRLDEAASAAALVGMPLHQLEVQLLRCQLAFHEGRFDDAREISDRLGRRPEGMGRRDQIALEILRNQMAIIDGDRVAAQSAMECIAKEARESGNVEISAEAWRALAESLAAANEVARGERASGAGTDRAEPAAP
jgi:transcriptional regulator with XRE-family HTH domain